MLENVKKIDKKLLAMVGVVLVFIILIIAIIILTSLTTGGSISFEKIEEKLETAAQSYCKDNDSLLPKEVGESTEIESSTLVSNGYIKDLSEYTDEDVVCSAKVIVAKTMDGYDYVANLDCDDDYETIFLADKLIEEVVTSGDGLYAMEDVVTPGTKVNLGIDEDGYDLATNELMSGYIYRGENLKNYIQLDGETFRIVKIDGNKDFSVTTIKSKGNGSYDNRYNDEKGQNAGINDYTISRAYENITGIYNSESKSGQIIQKAAPKNICIASRNNDDTATDGSIECREVMKNQFYSLIPVFDIMNASLSEKCDTTTSKDCSNYNFLSTSVTYWTLTPNDQNTYSAYKMSGSISSSFTNNDLHYKVLYYLSNRLVYVSGTGTKDDPYIVK